MGQQCDLRSLFSKSGPWIRWTITNHHQADGRDSDASKASPFRISREVCVPQFEQGFLHYIMMEIVANSDVDSGWVVKTQPTETTFPISTTMPVSSSYKAFSGVDTHGFARNAFQQPAKHILTDGKEGKLEGHWIIYPVCAQIKCYLRNDAVVE